MSFCHCKNTGYYSIFFKNMFFYPFFDIIIIVLYYRLKNFRSSFFAHLTSALFKCLLLNPNTEYLPEITCIIMSNYVDSFLFTNLQFFGKYSFQYVKNMTIKNSHLSTKDAFWHTDNVTVKDSILEGEYLGWYSKNLTLIRCHIKGTQPLCYCKNLTLIDCTMEETDLSFENSSVYASIASDIVSIKNPKKGKIQVLSYKQLILDNPKNKTKIITLKKGD